MSEFRIDPLNHLEVEIPIEDHIIDKEETETFKKLNQI